MSKNIDQIYIANPASSMVSTDLLYLGRSPYGLTDDFAITFAGFQTSITQVGTLVSLAVTGNTSSNNFVPGFATTATAAATTTLTVSSANTQEFTGSTTQILKLPVTSTLALGFTFKVINNSSGVVTVQSSGANSIQAMAGGTAAWFTCILTSGTTAASWDVAYIIESGGVSSITGTASQVIASSATGDVTLSLPQSIATSSVPTFANLVEGYATTATAAATTTLLVSSAKQQFFTGSTTQTVTLPVTSTLTLGQAYLIVNNSSGVVTVQSSGANTIQAMAANTSLLVTCILTSGTSAASWYANYDSAGGGSVTAGTANQLAYYATNGDNVSGTNTGTGVLTALAVNIGTAGSFVVNGGALGTPSSGVLSSTTGGGGLRSFQIFTSGTAATYTKPANVTSILVEAVGGGGGGGGAAISTGGGAAGGGGAGGGYCRLWVAAAAATYTYTVGPGGAGGTAGNNNGTAGTSTTFVGTGANIAAAGGNPGIGSPISTSSAFQGAFGSPGASSGGNVNINGGNGNYGYTTNAAGTGFTVGGYGGGTYLSTGGVFNPAVATGTDGNTNSGAGGSGGAATNNGTAFAGGAGATGIIIVWEFS